MKIQMIVAVTIDDFFFYCSYMKGSFYKIHEPKFFCYSILYIKNPSNYRMNSILSEEGLLLFASSKYRQVCSLFLVISVIGGLNVVLHFLVPRIVTIIRRYYLKRRARIVPTTIQVESRDIQ